MSKETNIALVDFDLKILFLHRVVKRIQLLRQGVVRENKNN